jgi:hypothetical protein
MAALKALDWTLQDLQKIILTVEEVTDLLASNVQPDSTCYCSWN